MHRPTRQHQHLTIKVAQKQERSARSSRKPGRKTKRWNKWLTEYAPLVAGAEAAATAAS
ncbi:uncharacterized protein SOCEGT47_051120 [Sorangium cellulosum]|jgi:hypothetical protein|uniref:Uncharacterized protein n=1 Tax=Sorangium cellulosum TaxID=56 RepID=A0A4P2Q580_SORCE|nr:hypothetical protein [Sorangium cellulosum]AUX24574.1 uncharacterized protein SOCEGT47_051120 [Sorangium cellulosum]